MENAQLAPQTTASIHLHDATGDAAPRLAAARIAPELEALADEDVLQVNVDIDTAVTHVIGYWKAVEALLPQIATLPNLDVTQVAKLHDYALALHYWHSLSQYASAPPAGLAAMAERGVAMRDRILSMLKALAKFGLVDESALAAFGGTTAHRKVARDLTGLSGLVHELWPALEGKSVLTLEEMDEAEHLGHAILRAVGDREASPAKEAHAARQRDKAFTLLARAHDQTRRALLFLRWDQGDADTIMPSIYAGRRSSKKREDAATAPATKSSTTPQPLALGAQQSSLLVDDATTLEEDDA